MAEQDLTRGPVWRALTLTSAPMVPGILAVLSVGLADAYFLGRLGADPLAAVGYVYPTTTAIVSLSIGLSAGANAAISQAIGRNSDSAHLTRLSLHALGLGAVLSLITALAFFAAYPAYFGAIGAGEQVQRDIAAYVPLWCASFPCLVVLMVSNAIFRAHGDAVSAALFMIAGAGFNLALNPILIFGWGPVEGMGTSGAALATLIGRALAMLGAVAYAIHLGYLRPCGSLAKRLARNLKTILSVGAPAAFSNAINPAGKALIVAAVATLGDTAVAGFGAATRVQAGAIVVLLALSAGISPVVGQNWGAEQVGRARAALAQAWGMCLAYGLVLAMILSLAADPIARAIASDAAAADYAAQYLRVVGWSLFGYGILVTANAAMNARSRAVYSMILGAARTFAVYLPLAWLGVGAFGYGGILAASIAANLAGVVGAVWFIRRAGLLPGWPRLRAARPV